MTQEEHIKRILHQIGVQHEALQAAYAALVAAHAAGTALCLEHLKEAADLYWELREKLERLPDAAREEGGGIELDFV